MYRLFMFIGRINTDFIHHCKWWERGIRAIWEWWTRNNYYWERGMLPEQWTGNNLQWEQWTENKKEARTLHGNTPYPPPPPCYGSVTYVCTCVLPEILLQQTGWNSGWAEGCQIDVYLISWYSLKYCTCAFTYLMCVLD